MQTCLGKLVSARSGRKGVNAYAPNPNYGVERILVAISSIGKRPAKNLIFTGKW